jgi:hypothetical protein
MYPNVHHQYNLMSHSNSHLWIGRMNLGHPICEWNTKGYVENLHHVLAHKIPYYGMRYLELEGVYGDQLERRLNVELVGQV